jgi:hypothetical protein
LREQKPSGSIYDDFNDLASTVHLLQDQIDQVATHPKVAHLMACTHVHAAYQDWHDHNRSEGTLTPSFFQTQAISTRNPETRTP